MKVTTAVPLVVRFDDDEATTHDLVGGKAASLGRLTQGGFQIPPGLTASTAGYHQFLRESGVDQIIRTIVPQLDYDDADALERLTAEIRNAVDEAPFPEDLARLILDGYHSLGDDAYVAVRSSGTAEDLAEASFAGLHDTYLDIRGDKQLLDAVKRCWGSMWTARSTSYRHHGGFDHATAALAVTIQKMVKADAAGVLFTANPLNARTDEFVVNASWGLGEGVVSGILTPDEFVLDHTTLAIKRAVLGTKEVRIVKDPTTGSGTTQELVPEDERDRFSLSDANVIELGALGQKVMAFSGGVPQDIEWAIADGKLYLLQSRNITGVGFTWDEEVDGPWQPQVVPEDTVWSHAFADEFWTGAITPLFFSVRGRQIHNINLHDFDLWGFDDLKKLRSLKWHGGTAYYNSNQDRTYDEYLLPPMLRGSTLWKIPPSWREEAAVAPWDFVQGVFTQLRILALEPDRSATRWFDEVNHFMQNRISDADGPSDEELRKLSDRRLKASLANTLEIAERFMGLLRPAFHYFGVVIPGLLNQMVKNWYSGDNKFLFQELISGMPRLVMTAVETRAVWKVAMEIGASDFLTKAFEEHKGLDFFAFLEGSEEGRHFLEFYRDELIIPHGHRGHADRDIWYKRRVEDYSLDYEAFRPFLQAQGGPTPEQLEHRLIEQREAAMADMIESIKGTAFASVKMHAFKLLHSYALKFLMVRDDERHYMDRITFAKKKHFREIGRRLFESGLIESEDDYYFLSLEELYECWEGGASLPLVKVKIANRRRVFESHLARTKVPAYIHDDGTAIADEPESEADIAGGILRGMGVSRGTITGTARIVKDLKEIGRVQKGEILICNSTDPGWASIFAIIGGLVLETGGMLAHGSCLSREYGLPAVTLRGAMSLIEDGATITVSGDTGEIRLAQPADAIEVGTDAN